MSAAPATEGPLTGPVLVRGVGLIGGSVAMALTRAGIATYLSDVDPRAAPLVASRGGGSDQSAPDPVAIVVVATPPDQLAEEIAAALARHPAAVVTDVGSVKALPLAQLRRRGLDLSRYVGGHPMAGSERSGPFAAARDLFEGRTWAVVPRPENPPAAVAAVTRLAQACGAAVIEMTTEEHDAAVARTSHLPHLLAALAAARLGDAPPGHLALSGPGVRDVTRVAAGRPALWAQILRSNATALAELLLQVRGDIDDLVDSLQTGDETVLQRVLDSGVAGIEKLPGKHGTPAQEFSVVTVVIPDAPGALARLFGDVGRAGVNIEDVRIDHDPARSYGQVEVEVAADRVEPLVTALRAGGWAVHR